MFRRTIRFMSAVLAAVILCTTPAQTVLAVDGETQEIQEMDDAVQQETEEEAVNEVFPKQKQEEKEEEAPLPAEEKNETEEIEKSSGDVTVEDTENASDETGEIAAKEEEEAEVKKAAEAVISTGPYKDAGSWRYRGTNGEDLTGWIQDAEGKWYYADKNGVLLTGLQTVKKKQYYLDPETHIMRTGAVPINGKFYYFVPGSGARKTDSSWITAPEGKYYAGKNGVLKTGWQTIKKKRYYFVPSTALMAEGPVKIGNTWYGFKRKTGVLVKNAWGQDRAGEWFYADKKGTLTSGWKKIKKKWYYFDPSTMLAARGLLEISGEYYYFDMKNCDMKTGWINAGGSTRYYANSKGTLVTGWQTISKKKYYFHPDCHMQTQGEAEIGDYICVFGKDGVFQMQLADISKGVSSNYTGYAMDGKTKVHVTAGRVDKGWYKSSGKWYFSDKSTGKVMTGWLKDGGKTYYLGSDGCALTGLQTISGKGYLFADNGSMLTGVQRYKGNIYIIGDNGVRNDSLTRTSKYYDRLTKDEQEFCKKMIRAAFIDKSAVTFRVFENYEKQKTEADAFRTMKFHAQDTVSRMYYNYDWQMHFECAERSINGRTGREFVFNQDDLRRAEKYFTENEKLRKYIQSAVQKSGAKSKKSDREKIKAIDNYICKTMTYDESYRYKTITECITSGRGVCHQYACYFLLMCREVNIRCLYIYGTAGSSGAEHAWNRVMIGSKWYYVDSTWNDDGNKSGRRYFLSEKQLANHTFKNCPKSTDYWE